MNCYSVGCATKVQNVSVITKVAALSIIVVAAIVYVSLGKEHDLSEFKAASRKVVWENSDFRLKKCSKIQIWGDNAWGKQ